ncbi:hypothetical protein J2Z83_001742 [Virgibacillus natechei]|uniref:Uncharacterized protein n=1 Tax=Virgibacillus natechei TaxID=1216297 RepID=A0ABS4IGC6_9BACI|nr:hypothetical protein [Virgibacillus natechei]MBP1969635.1 hypothetical protein [Virgibacillus natechei]UZD11363.1 hypothetical protein OLD84_10310 [Virgibacillus natechei]
MNHNSSNQEDQATELRSLLNDVEQGGREKVNQSDKRTHSMEENQKVDILNLPPRKDVHSHNKKRTHLRIGNPLLRFIIVFIILLSVFIGAYYVWGEELINFITNL